MLNTCLYEVSTMKCSATGTAVFLLAVLKKSEGDIEGLGLVCFMFSLAGFRNSRLGATSLLIQVLKSACQVHVIGGVTGM